MDLDLLERRSWKSSRLSKKPGRHEGAEQWSMWRQFTQLIIPCSSHLDLASSGLAPGSTTCTHHSSHKYLWTRSPRSGKWWKFLPLFDHWTPSIGCIAFEACVDPKSHRRMAKKGSHTHHISLLTNGWSTWDFFFRNCQGKGGTEFQNDYDVTVFFVSFFCVNRWLLQILQWPNSVCIWLPKPAHVFFWTALCTWKPITTVGWYVHVVNSRCNKRREYIMWKRVFGVCAMKFCEIWCLNVSIMLHWKKQIAKHIHLSLVVFGWKPRV